MNFLSPLETHIILDHIQGLGLGLWVVLGLGAVFLGGNCPRTDYGDTFQKESSFRQKCISFMGTNIWNTFGIN